MPLTGGCRQSRPPLMVNRHVIAHLIDRSLDADSQKELPLYTLLSHHRRQHKNPYSLAGLISACCRQRA